MINYKKTGLKKKVARQMLAHPQIAISGMADDKWIRLTAEAVHDERIEAQHSRFITLHRLLLTQTVSQTPPVYIQEWVICHNP